jgi:hypothetical protein
MKLLTRELADALIARLAVEYPDCSVLIAPDVFADWLSAQVSVAAIDVERPAFEEWYANSWGGSSFGPELSRDSLGQYRNHHAHNSWVVWRARAGIKP